ncbi:PrsW family intramembrane metalloprotease [Streptosporangium sp. G11]|uniref:PrsW family intramembrane metalloprotease n=1 Tax=Streptosporangium sp. G11 TaxID=3436926 RepID=UPI003EBD95F4
MGTDFGAWFRPLVITPVTEEVFKGLFLVWLLICRRGRITGLLDGIVYAGLAGAGFSFTENILYFGRIITTFAASDTSDVNAVAVLGASLFLRVVMVPFFHPLMVAVSGLGIAAVSRRGGAARVGLALAGLLVAITLHGVWDWSSLAGGDPFLIYKIYGAVMVPVFLATLIVALVLRNREGKMIRVSSGLGFRRFAMLGEFAGEAAEHEVDHGDVDHGSFSVLPSEPPCRGPGGAVRTEWECSTTCPAAICTLFSVGSPIMGCGFKTKKA